MGEWSLLQRQDNRLRKKKHKRARTDSWALTDKERKSDKKVLYIVYSMSSLFRFMGALAWY